MSLLCLEPEGYTSISRLTSRAADAPDKTPASDTQPFTQKKPSTMLFVDDHIKHVINVFTNTVLDMLQMKIVTIAAPQ